MVLDYITRKNISSINLQSIEEYWLPTLKNSGKSGVEPGQISRKTGTSTQYIGTLEIKGKFPSSEMVHKSANALRIDPTELFYKEIAPETVIRRNAQKAVIEDILEAVNQLIADFLC